MKGYVYYSDVKKNAIFTEEACQFCGIKKDCLEGVYFEQEDVKAVCLSCLNSKKTEVNIPEHIKNRIRSNKDLKNDILKYTPPIPWVQYNDWQVCCDDYMQYIGEWEQEDFINESEDGDGVNFLKSILSSETLCKVDEINVLWEDIGYDTVAYIFKCNNCKKNVVVCQSY